MKTILAVENDELEQYITKNTSLDVIGIAISKIDLLTKCKELPVDIVIISSSLFLMMDIKEIITQLTSYEDYRIRIICLYGEKNSDCKEFIDFLISRGVYDYYIGENITSHDLDSLIHNVIARSGVKQNTIDNVTKESLKSSWINSHICTQRKVRDIPVKTIVIKELETAVITLFSNHVTGKTHTAWNLAYCLSRRGYKTSLLNLDNGYSANIYYGINEIYYALLEHTIKSKSYKDILDNCYKRKNLNVITGQLGDTSKIRASDFLELFYFIHSGSEITIIDTGTGLDEITRLAVMNSTINLLIFDSDLMHFHQNRTMIDAMGNDFIPEKTIAVINNCDIKSESYRYVYNQIKKMRWNFKKIIPLSSCGSISCDMMHTDSTPYEASRQYCESFKEDMDELLNVIKVRENKGILRRFL